MIDLVAGLLVLGAGVVVGFWVTGNALNRLSAQVERLRLESVSLRDRVRQLEILEEI